MHIYVHTYIHTNIQLLTNVRWSQWQGAVVFELVQRQSLEGISHEGNVWRPRAQPGGKLGNVNNEPCHTQTICMYDICMYVCMYAYFNKWSSNRVLVHLCMYVGMYMNE